MKNPLPILLLAALAAAGCSKAPSTSSVGPGGAEAVTIEEVDSAYTRITVKEYGDLRGLYFSRQGVSTLQSAMKVGAPLELPIAYERYMTVGLAYLPQPPKRIMVIGLGAASSSRYLMHFLPEAQIDVVELDSEVIRLAKDYFHLPTDPRYHLANEDGRVFATRAQDGSYDMILLDAYSHAFAPFHLTTKEFLSTLKRKLAPGGIMAQNVASTVSLVGRSASTAEAVFDHLDAYEASGNVIFIGYDGPLISDETLVGSAIEQQNRLQLPYSLKILVAARGEVADAAKGEILTDDYSPSEILAAQPASRLLVNK